jgi:hypothetical protein
MKTYPVLVIITALLALFLTTASTRADNKELSPERLDMLDQAGYFTPAFKAAVHDLVDNKEALERAKAEDAELIKGLPDLQKQATEAEAKAVALRQELATYEHPDETDFDALQTRMNDSNAKPEEQLPLAQAYVWTYPDSPHEGDAQQYLQQLLKTLANQKQAEKDAEAAKEDARAKLVQRAKAHDLNLDEWRVFLRDMSQDELVKLLGRPTTQTSDYWIYTGDWIVDPATKQKAGMEVNFNAGRVSSVDEK